VAWHVGQTIPHPQAPDGHFLVKAKAPVLNVQATRHLGANGPESILNIREPSVETHVHAGLHNPRSDSARQVVQVSIQFVAPAGHAASHHKVGIPPEYGFEQTRYVARPVRAVGINKDENVSVCFQNTGVLGETFAPAPQAEHAGATGLRHLTGSVFGSAVDDQDVIDMPEAVLNNPAYSFVLVQGWNNSRDSQNRLHARMETFFSLFRV
jgi:hypothetical protein